MNSKFLLIILFIFFCNKLFSEDSPKNIIVIEENLELEKSDVDQNDARSKDERETYLEEEVSGSGTKEYDNLIVIDDIPKEFNDWFGILSSEEGGLGWQMWGSTKSELAKSLLNSTNFSTDSPTLLKLTSQVLMSRAQKPKENRNEGTDISLSNDSKLRYLKEKIRILSSIGDNENISRLIDNIPLEIKTNDFYNLIYDLRKSDKDIPYICNELQKKKFDLQKDIEKRKTLIACNVAKNEYNKAQLALDLLENDSIESLSYIQTVRSFLEKPSVKILLLDEKNLQYKNYKIISLSNYKVAKKIFSNDSLTLNKIIYDMKLYTIKDQIESLEKLVSFGLYDPVLLKNAYTDYYLSIKDTINLDNLIKAENDNSLDVRVSLFYLINNTISDIDRAKLLNLLWLKAEKINVEKALYSITSNSINSLIPKRELSWFIYPVSRALISNKKIEEAKNWLFFIANNFEDRAALDLNFCKMLLLLYIADIDLKKSNFEIPDINFLLNVLDNSLEVRKENIYSLMITLKALNYEVSSGLWDNFYIDGYKSFSQSLNENQANLLLILEESLKKRNLAETVFITIDLLNSSNKEKLNFYYMYKSIYSLNNIGLREYARNLGLEINLDL